MKFSYNWLQSYFKKKLPKPEKLAEILTMHSFEVQGILKNGKDHLLDIDILPNRMSDCASHLGIAKECSALLNYELKIKNYNLKKNSKLHTKDYIKLEVKDESLCPRYTGLLIRNVKVGPSPSWLKERLLSVGQKPINNIVDAANYIMLETGQPLHAFDLKKIQGQKIVVRRAKEGEKLTTLDNRSVVFQNDMLVIADAEEALVVAGIKGGKKAEISEETKDIIVEAAIFNPISIRNTSRVLSIKTDASLRFEQGLSVYLPELVMNDISGLIQEISGGEVAKTAVDSVKAKPRPIALEFKDSDVSGLIGKEVRRPEIVRILKSLNFEISHLSLGRFKARPPLFRTDIKIKEDIIEEIARIYGYNEILREIPEETLLPPERNDEYFFLNIIRGILSGIGFSEVYNYSLRKSGNPSLKLKNPFSEDRSHLREDLLSGLENNISANFRYFDEVKIFEIGKVFFPLKGHPGEKTLIAAALGYKNNKLREKEVFYELKGVLEILLNKMGIDDVFFRESGKSSADAISGNEIIGRIEKRGFELDLFKIISLSEEDQAYRPVSKYPAITRDLSLFVPYETKTDEVTDVIENTAGRLLVDTDLFDIYEPEGGDKKSLAFHLIFQSEEKTLTDKEANDIVNKIIKALEDNLEWEVRK